jgi:hypothetical protein
MQVSPFGATDGDGRIDTFVERHLPPLDPLHAIPATLIKDGKPFCDAYDWLEKGHIGAEDGIDMAPRSSSKVLKIFHVLCSAEPTGQNEKYVLLRGLDKLELTFDHANPVQIQNEECWIGWFIADENAVFPASGAIKAMRPALPQ